MAINNSLELLKQPFKNKAIVFLKVIRKTYPNVAPFETLRTRARQIMLMARWSSWTLKSKHLDWLACDWVFMNKWQPTRKGDYWFLQRLGWMCWMVWISKEQCHTQDSWTPISIVMSQNSRRYKSTTNKREQELLHDVNEEFRKLWYKS